MKVLKFYNSFKKYKHQVLSRHQPYIITILYSSQNKIIIQIFF